VKRIAEMPRRTQDELARLHRLEIAAWETGQIETAITCKLRWCDLYREADGCSSPQPRLIVTSGGTAAARRVNSAKRWKQENTARPLVAVKQSREVLYSDNAGNPHCYYVLTLACGHQMTDYAIDPTTPAPKRRRCKECGSAIIEAREPVTQEQPLKLAAEQKQCPSYEPFRLGS
jgi:hypothetical protein